MWNDYHSYHVAKGAKKLFVLVDVPPDGPAFCMRMVPGPLLLLRDEDGGVSVEIVVGSH